MKKIVKKISFILVIAIILSSQVMASSLPVPPVSDVSNQNIPVIVWIRYVLEIALVLTNIVIIVKSIIKNIKIKDKSTKIKYFVYMILIAILLVITFKFYLAVRNIAGGFSEEGNILALIILNIIPTILNIILYTQINKKSKKLKEGGESKCQE